MQRLDTCSCSSCSRVGGIALGRCPRAYSPTNCGRAYLALAVRHRGARAKARRQAPAIALYLRGVVASSPLSQRGRDSTSPYIGPGSPWWVGHSDIV